MASPEWFLNSDFDDNLVCSIYYPEIDNPNNCVISSDGYTNEQMDTPTAHIHPLEDFTELLIPTIFWANKANDFDTEKFVVDYKEQEGAFLS